MLIKTPLDSDIPKLIAIAIETFEPFYEGYVHPLLGDAVFQHQHGNWRKDYESNIPTLHFPEEGRIMALAEVEGLIVGFIAWKTGAKEGHGEIYLLAVAPNHRRTNVGRTLCLHVMQEMKSKDVVVVEIGTGGDAFHAPARALYESLGFAMIPVAAYLKKI
ncbi:MAG TPA: GNAT family N-acetyltransferase [Acidimicrobiales bacterium]|nr:GNAT family N-acetyltransferase [Acidimicrobiales bacterium]